MILIITTIIVLLLGYFLYRNYFIENFTSKTKSIKKRKACNNLKLSKDIFIASSKFKGAKKGYIFKKDKKGLGYYLDTKYSD